MRRPRRGDRDPRPRNASWLVLAMAVALAALTGCFQSGTQPANTGSTVSSEFLSLAEIEASVGLTSEQAAAVAPAHSAWQHGELEWERGGRMSGEPPVLDFVAACAAVLDHGQMGRLISGLHVFEAGHLRLPDLEDPLFGSPMGPGSGMGRGHHGRHPGPGPGPGPFPDLGLTDEQKAQIRTAQQEMRDAIRELAGQLRSGTITPAEFEAGVDVARAAFETALQGILTAEQYAKLQQARRDHLIAVLEARLASFERGVARLASILDRVLDLSDDQATGVTAILTGTRPAIEAVLAGLQDNSLSPQQAQEDLEQIAADAAAAIRAQLTEEQAVIFDRLQHLRRLFPGCHA